MFRLRSLWMVAPLLLGACSLINAPAEVDTGTGGQGGSGGGGAGGAPTTSTAGGSTSTGMPSECGDGKLEGSEECDDDNLDAGDGCGATCSVEAGWECTSEPDVKSACNLICGNGTVDAGEECDDEAKEDMDPPSGNQDYCSAECKFQEFDIESGADNSGVVHELPAAGYRRDNDMPSFIVLWHAANAGKILSREYNFDGSFKKANFMDTATSPNPDDGGEVLCTAGSNRSILAWRDSQQNQVYTRRIESTGTMDPAVPSTFVPNPQPSLSCAASPADTFIVTTMAKGGGNLHEVLVQPYALSGQPLGGQIDIGDAAGLGPTASWGIGGGFLVAWIADPANNGNISAQQLKDTGELEPGFIFQLSDPADIVPREPAGGRLGMQGQFAFVYTRDSAPDGMGVTHREVVYRVFQSPGNGSAPTFASVGTSAQREPVLGVNPTTGKFVIAWTFVAGGGENIAYRVFSQTGMPMGDEQVANEVLTGKQTKPAIVVDPFTGDVVILWDNEVPNSVKPHKVSAKIFPKLLE
jgi:cysteine-rich repeat protein